MRKYIILLTLAASCAVFATQPIDRKTVVRRNNPHVTTLDTLASLTVGNGGFAFTVDATGLQTFPRMYANGVPLGTMSDWGWHSFDNPQNLRPEEALKAYDFGHGHTEWYSTQYREAGRQHDASEWYRQNPHRMHLGAVGLDLQADKITDLDQTLDLWTGMIDSRFSYEGRSYHVQTVCHPTRDMIATRIETDDKRAVVRLDFPYPTGKHSDDACNWDEWEKNLTSFDGRLSNATDTLKRVLDGKSRFDAADYYVAIHWGEGTHTHVNPGTSGHPTWNKVRFKCPSRVTTFTCEFFEQKDPGRSLMSFDEVARASASYWERFWTEGAIVDFSDCTDPRAAELERRVVLSQYLLAVNDAGDTPPQETGLTYNSWFGKFHLEMIWWHQAQFALWGHPELLDHTLEWYFKAEPMAREIARRQGFNGVRWMKMTDPSAAEAPSNVGSFLIWQQPHLIYLAELLYRAAPDAEKKQYYLRKYGHLIEETALFMHSFATYDHSGGRYVLKGCIPAQETLRAAETVNPPFELSYWHYAMQVAQAWRERSGMPRHAEWDELINRLSPLASKDSLYLAAETAPQTYEDIRFTSDHPAVLGAVGILPMTPQADAGIMRNTLHWILDHWNWDKTWGWDFPMVAMNAARMGEPENAVNALLMDKRTNTYLPNGHNFQDNRLRLYLPGNGGLLTAVAMMCAGWDGHATPNPGFPSDGSWNVRWEGLLPMP